MNPAVHQVNVVRVGPTIGAALVDVAATEEPLELRLGGVPFVVIMRTPGSDHELAAGFLLSEQIVSRPTHIAAMRHCSDEQGPDGQPTVVEQDGSASDVANVLNVWLTGEAGTRAAAALAGKRHVTVSSSCGVCGRRSIDELLQGVNRLDGTGRVSRVVVSAIPDRLRAAQKTFNETGGLHAAGLFEGDGTLLSVAEDVGRHNAVDKVIGRELLAGRLPLSNRVLFVSGRTSFEIVQKAVVAGITVLASVSAPSSLAIELAREASLTLLGFVRDGTFNIYTGAERIAL
jgi:FdhD protein